MRKIPLGQVPRATNSIDDGFKTTNLSTSMRTQSNHITRHGREKAESDVFERIRWFGQRCSEYEEWPDNSRPTSPCNRLITLQSYPDSTLVLQDAAEPRIITPR